MTADADEPETDSFAEAPQPAPITAGPNDPTLLDLPSAEEMEEGGDELLLDAGSMMSPPEPAEEAAPGSRSWIGPVSEEEEQATPQPVVRREGGTLFERMSNIARGAQKAQVEEEPAAPSRRRDPLDIPRFLGRQNNQ